MILDEPKWHPLNSTLCHLKDNKNVTKLSILCDLQHELFCIFITHRSTQARAFIVLKRLLFTCFRVCCHNAMLGLHRSIQNVCAIWWICCVCSARSCCLFWVGQLLEAVGVEVISVIRTLSLVRNGHSHKLVANYVTLWQFYVKSYSLQARKNFLVS